MPVVRASRQVAAEALPGARLDSALTPESQGSQLAAARGEVAQQLSGVGALGVRLSVATEVGIRQEAKKQADLIASTEDENYLSNLREHIVSDPNDGFMNVTGKDATGLLDSVPKQWTDGVASYADTITDPMRKARLMARAGTHGSAVQEDLYRHVHQEQVKYGGEVVQARELSALSLAETQASNPLQAGALLADGVKPYKEWAKLRGVSDEVINQHVDDYLSTGHTRVITRLLAEQKDIQATEYFTEVKAAGGFTGKDLAHVTEMVAAGSTDGQGERNAGVIWSTYMKGKTDTDPINLADLRQQALDKAGDDNKLFKATYSALLSRKAAEDDSRKEAIKGRNDGTWGVIVDQLGKKVPIQQIEASVRSSPTFASLPGDERLRLVNWFRSEEDRRVNRAYTEGLRADAAYGREQRRLEDTQYSEYFRLQTPDQLSQLSKQDIVAKLPELGHAHVQRLLNDKEQLDRATYTAKERDEKLQNAHLDEVTFKDAVRAAFPQVDLPPSKQKEADTAQLGRLQVSVRQAIVDEQVSKGRELTAEERQDTIRKSIERKVYIDKPFSFDQQTVAAAVANKDDVEKAYVPMAEIRSTPYYRDNRILESHLAFIRKTYAQQTKGKTDDQVISLFERRIERAVAHGILVPGDPDGQRAILRGER